jgi:hypothetical protein
MGRRFEYRSCPRLQVADLRCFEPFVRDVFAVDQVVQVTLDWQKKTESSRATIPLRSFLPSANLLAVKYLYLVWMQVRIELQELGELFGAG